MSGTPRGGGATSAWAVNWRNPQARKNKSWENDGFLHVQGPTLTLYGEEGNKIGQKNFLRPLAEGTELSVAGREVRIDYSMTTQEMWSKIRGEGSSRGTPAPAAPVRPGFLTRPDTRTTPQAQSTRPQYRSMTPQSAPSLANPRKSLDSASRPRSSLAKSTQDVFRADTPEQENVVESETSHSSTVPTSATKTWIDPKKHVQKPFKFPTPIRRTSPALEYGPTSVPAKPTSRRKSRLQEQSQGEEADEEEDDSDDDEREAARRVSRDDRAAKQGKLASEISQADDVAGLAMARNDWIKGKGVKREETDNDDAEQLRSSGRAEASDDQDEEERPGPTPPKKRKLDHATSSQDQQAPPVGRKPRVSAADLALSRSMATEKSGSSSSTKHRAYTDNPKNTSSSRPRPPIKHESDLRPKAEPVDATDLFLDASSLAQDDDFGLGGDGAGMDWDEGDDLNEEGMLDEMADEQDGSASDDSGRSSVTVKSAGRQSSGSGLEARGDEKTRYFSCQWRKHSTKKNPTWEGDGVLKIDKSGKATIKDAETGKEIGSTTLMKNISLAEDTIIKLGNKEVEIGTLTDRRAYAGENCETPAAPVAPSSIARNNLSSSSRPSTSVAARPGLSSLSKGFTMPGIATKPAGIKAGSFYNKPDPASQNSRSPRALFDPKQEGAIVMKRPDDDHQAMYNKRNHPVVDVVIDPKLGEKLRPHQQAGVRFLYECVMGMSTKGQGAILADEMGLGKTIQSIALIWTLLKQNPYHSGGFSRAGVIERAMIVCPVTLVKNWATEIKKWLGKDALRVMVADGPTSAKTFANSRSYNVLIVGYEKLVTAIEDIRFAQPPIGLMICDEGHRLKSSNTKTAKAIASLSCLRRVILSGTPIQNNLGEFFTMMNFVNPGLLNDYNYFKKHYEQPILKSRREGASKEEKRIGRESSESLADIQRNFFLRRTADLLQKHLPPKFEYTVFVVPNQREVDIYQEVLASSAVRRLLSGKGGTQQLRLLVLLRHCATTPGLLMHQAKSDQEKNGEESIFSSDLTDLFPTEIPYWDFALSSKLAALGEMLKELRTGNEKIVVVSNFTSTLDIIEKYCKKFKYPVCRLDGKTAQSERIPMVNAFNRGTRTSHFIFLLSSKSGGTGLNIIGASRLVLLDSEWNPSTDLQAMARIHRDGQEKTCVLYRFLTAGTIDEKIYQRQITKIALSGSVMEEDQTSDSNKGDAFTMDDLKNIFRLHVDTTCQTHDLLGCGCHRGENPESLPSQEKDEDTETDDSDEDLGGFVPASQWNGEAADKKVSSATSTVVATSLIRRRYYVFAQALKKAHRNLSILKTWNHYDCSDFDAYASIEDDLLRKLIANLYEHVDPNERLVQSLPDFDDVEAAGQKMEVRGGQVGWVFEKKHEEMGRKKQVTPEYVDEGVVDDSDDD
ncbi:hypothetical protein JCM11491_002629 [Sporobolomyces phaffii]